jgi:hypothetical protein
MSLGGDVISLIGRAGKRDSRDSEAHEHDYLPNVVRVLIMRKCAAVSIGNCVAAWVREKSLCQYEVIPGWMDFNL